MPEWLASPKMWGDIFTVGVPIAEKVLRPVLVYAFLVVALRVPVGLGQEVEADRADRQHGSFEEYRHQQQGDDDDERGRRLTE